MKIKKIILPPLIGFFIILPICFLLAINFLQDFSATHSARVKLGSIEKFVRQEINGHTRFMLAYLENFHRDGELVRLFKDRKRKALLDHCESIFQFLNQYFGITHFYFHTPEGKNFLRIHHPEYHGDVIDRFTLKDAMRDKKTSHGLELGPSGSFTLRVVSPLLTGEALVGYLELGIEFSNFLSLIEENLDIQYILLVKSAHINPAHLQKDPLPEPFEQIRDYAMVHKSFQALPLKMGRQLDHFFEPDADLFLKLEKRGKSYIAGMLPVSEAGRRRLANLLIFHEITDIEKKFNTIAKYGGALTCIVSVMLIWFLLRYLNVVEQKVNNAFAMLRRETEQNKKLAEDNTLLALFPKNNPYPVLRLSLADYMILFANQAASDMFDQLGWKLTEPMPSPVKARLVSGITGDHHFQFKEKIGDFWYNFFTVPVKGNNELYLYARDITEHYEYETKLLMLDAVMSNSHEGVTITDAEGNIEYVNSGFSSITGYSDEEVLGKNPRILKSERHSPDFYKTMWGTIIETGKWEGEIWNRRKNGETYPQWLSITAIRDDTSLLRYIGVFHDITDLKKGEELLFHQAYHDALTGLPNRKLLIDRMEMAIANASRHNENLAVLYIDFDNFKKINDSLGHYTGDLFLQEVAGNLHACIRNEDTLARIGGDEFVIMVVRSDFLDQAAMIAQRIVNLFRDPVCINGNELFSSVSIGIACYPNDGKQPDELLQKADMAMYKAKQEGKNNYVLFTRSLNSMHQARLALEKGLRYAILHDEIIVYYQPKITAASGKIKGVEALARWRKKDGSLVPPGEFIPVAEETGLIAAMGRTVMETACRQGREWHDRGLKVSMAVNLSPKQLQQDDLVETVQMILAETGFNPRCLELEITETAVMNREEQALVALNRLKKLGIRLAMDDFGTGYSSLAYLKLLPLDTLKIDRSFINDLPDDKNDIAITDAALNIARSLGLVTVGEGVENEVQHQFLKDRGCEQLQGYFYSKPHNADRITKMLLSEKQVP